MSNILNNQQNLNETQKSINIEHINQLKFHINDLKNVYENQNKIMSDLH